MSVFDEDLFRRGLDRRKATLGARYVESNLAAADSFTRPFQEAMTAWCWGFGWGDDAIDAKTRSMMNLAMIGALGRMHEWEVHCRGRCATASAGRKSGRSSMSSGSIAACRRPLNAFAWRGGFSMPRRRLAGRFRMAMNLEGGRRLAVRSPLGVRPRGKFSFSGRMRCES